MPAAAGTNCHPGAMVVSGARLGRGWVCSRSRLLVSVSSLAVGLGGGSSNLSTGRHRHRPSSVKSAEGRGNGDGRIRKTRACESPAKKCMPGPATGSSCRDWTSVGRGLVELFLEIMPQWEAISGERQRSVERGQTDWESHPPKAAGSWLIDTESWPAKPETVQPQMPCQAPVERPFPRVRSATAAVQVRNTSFQIQDLDRGR